MTALFTMYNIAKLAWNLEGEASETRLFSGVSAEWTKPEKIALIGPSGQGKSTLLRIMALLDQPDEGDLLLNGVSFRDTDPRLWRMAVAYVSQQAVMLPGSINDNLYTVSRLHNFPYDPTLASQLMAQVGLDHLDLNKQARACSGGEKQRISLVRTLLMRPSILLLDEITASLDVNSTQKVEELLAQWHAQEGTSLIWVTHDLEQARRSSDRLWFMEDRTMREYNTAEFFQHSKEELT